MKGNRLAILVTTIILCGIAVFSGRAVVTLHGQTYTPQRLYFDVSDVTGLRDAIAALSVEPPSPTDCYNPQRHSGIIRLRPGIYELGTTGLTLTCRSNVSIIGSGDSTEIHYHGSAAAFTFDYTNNLIIRDLGLMGTAHDSYSAGHTGIQFTHDEARERIESSRFEGFTYSGIRFDGNGNTSSNWILQNWFVFNQNAQLYAKSFNDFHIIGNQFGFAPDTSGTDNVGVWLEDSSAGTYTMNYHWGNVIGLALMGRSDYNRIENNRFEESQREGLRISGPTTGWPYSQFNVITGNTIHTNSHASSGTYPAVSAQHSTYVTFTNNQIFSWNSGTYKHSNALDLTNNCLYWTIKDNMFLHSQNAGQVHLGTTDVSGISGLDSSGGNLAQAPTTLVQP